MDLGVGEMGFIYCGKHPLLVTRTLVRDPGPMDPLVLFIQFNLKMLKVSFSTVLFFKAVRKIKKLIPPRVPILFSKFE